MKTYGVAIQGAGNVSTEHIKAYINNPHTEVVAIGSRTKKGALDKVKEMELSCDVYDDYDEMLKNEKVDIVSICTPAERHSIETIKAAEADKHILVEKPIATNFEELRAMRDAVRAAKVKTVVSFVLRWNPLFDCIKALLADDALGTVFFVETDYWHGRWHHTTYPTRHRPGSPRKPLSSFLGGGCHAVDAARYFLESNITEVMACNPESGKTDPARSTMALVKFEDGATGKISATTQAFMPYVFNIELLGDKGVIRNNQLASQKFPGQTTFTTIPTILPDSGAVSHHPFQGEIDHLVECILNNVESHCNVEDAVNTHEVCFAAEMSAERNGEKIKLPMLE